MPFARRVAIDPWAGHCPESMITVVLSTREDWPHLPRRLMPRSQPRRVVAAAEVVVRDRGGRFFPGGTFEMPGQRNIINDPYVGN